jgi:hypothetical protein
LKRSPQRENIQRSEHPDSDAVYQRAFPDNGSVELSGEFCEKVSDLRWGF